VVVRQPCHPLPPLCLCPSHREKVRHSTAQHSTALHCTAQHIPLSLHRQLYLLTFYNLHLYNYTQQYFVCYSFLHLNFFTLHKQFQHLNSDRETCAGTNPFGSFRGPSQSLILSSRDRDNTAGQDRSKIWPPSLPTNGEAESTTRRVDCADN
jgi:hypothetical protein